MIKRHPQIAFFVLAYAVAWAFVPFGFFGAFGPLVAALVVIPLTRGRAGLRELGSRLVRWRVRWFWYLVALGVPLAIHLVTAGLHTAAGDDVPPVTAASVSAAVLTFLVRLVQSDGRPPWRGTGLARIRPSRDCKAATRLLRPPPSWRCWSLAGTSRSSSSRRADWNRPFSWAGWSPPSRSPTGTPGCSTTRAAACSWCSWRTASRAAVQAQGWTYMAVWCVVAVGLIVCDLHAWRRPPRTPIPPTNSHRSVTKPRPGQARALMMLLGAGCLMTSPASLVPAAANPAPDLASIDAYIEQEMREVRIPGLALGIVHNDEVVHLRGFGEAGPDGRAVTAQTPFILASASKSFTALAIMQLVESGKIDLDAPVSALSPRLPGGATRQPQLGSRSATCCTTPAACRRTAPSGRCSATTSATKRSATGSAPWRTCSLATGWARCSSTPTPTTTCSGWSCRRSAASPTSPTSPNRSSRRWA